MKQKVTKRALLIAMAVVLMAGGLYILFLTIAPQITAVPSPYKSDPKAVLSRPETANEDYVYIEKLGLLVPIHSGDKSMLEQGAWWRFPERGDPVKGGNFILSGHRFKLGWTPQRTKKQSPFYHFDQLKVDDIVLVHFKGKDYHYKITRNYAVKPNETNIEAPSDTPKLTIYTCTLKGSADGRTVIESIPI